MEVLGLQIVHRIGDPLRDAVMVEVFAVNAVAECFAVNTAAAVRNLCRDLLAGTALKDSSGLGHSSRVSSSLEESEPLALTNFCSGLVVEVSGMLQAHIETAAAGQRPL